MRVRRAAALDRHLLSVSLCTSSLCDTSSHVFSVKPFFEIVLKKSINISQIASPFHFEPDQSIGSPDRAPSFWGQAVGYFHKEHHEHFSFPILFCPIQPTLQRLFSELRILFEKLVQLLLHGIREGFSVQTEFSPFPLEKAALSPILDFVYLSTMSFRRLFMTQHLAQVSLCLTNP